MILVLSVHKGKGIKLQMHLAGNIDVRYVGKMEGLEEIDYL